MTRLRSYSIKFTKLTHYLHYADRFSMDKFESRLSWEGHDVVFSNKYKLRDSWVSVDNPNDILPRPSLYLRFTSSELDMYLILERTSGAMSPCNIATTRAMLGRLLGIAYMHTRAMLITRRTSSSSPLCNDIVGSTRAMSFPSSCNLQACHSRVRPN